MSRIIYDIDPAGDVLCTYTDNDNDQKESLRIEKTYIPAPRAILYAFLPAGFPHSVTTDYLPYQTYDSLQAFASSITSLLANRAVLEGLGVGDSSSSPTGALILKITGDTISRIATILFAHRMGSAIEPECKFYRFLADIFNDAAQFLDLLTPALPYLPKLCVIVCAGVLRSLCGVAANASKASLSAHFALTGNLAELNAKEASQETIVSLLGMLVGSLVVKVVEDKQTVWVLMIMLVGVHLAMNYRAVRAVRMRSLNRQRATIVFREWLETGRILGPEQVAQRESILTKGGGQVWSKSGEYKGTCDFGTYGDIKGWRPPRFGIALFGITPRGKYHRYEFETKGYFMGIWHRGGTFYMRIALKEGGDFGSPSTATPTVPPEGSPSTSESSSTSSEKKGLLGGPAPRIEGTGTPPGVDTPAERSNAALSAWFDAVNHAYHFDTALKDGLESHYENETETPLGGYVSEEQKATVFAALTAAGWDLDTNALETRLPVRVRVGVPGDGRGLGLKAPLLSEKERLLGGDGLLPAHHRHPGHTEAKTD